jgi:short-subunit dehydrogenase
VTDVMRPGTPRQAPAHVVITGASSGIGAALARVYGVGGTRLSLIARDHARLDDVAGICRRQGADVDVHVADVTDAAAIADVLVDCDLRQPVDLLIANAGIGGKAALAPNEGEPGDVARAIITTNLLGVVNTVTSLLPRFVARRHGQIAIVSSLGGLLGLPDSPAYSASKAGVYAYGEGLRRLVARFGVGVTIICPGFIDTPMSASLPGRLHFLWSAERAAAHIAAALARGRRTVLFPRPVAAVMRLLAVLPPSLSDRILMWWRIAK